MIQEQSSGIRDETGRRSVVRNSLPLEAHAGIDPVSESETQCSPPSSTPASACSYARLPRGKSQDEHLTDDVFHDMEEEGGEGGGGEAGEEGEKREKREKREEGGEDSRNAETRSKQLTVCLVSDFFYPGLGGVEMHLFHLAVCLLKRDVRVIVITHSRDAPINRTLINASTSASTSAEEAQRRNKVPRQRDSAKEQGNEAAVGVHYMANGLKVYYIPYATMYDNCVWPGLGVFAHVFRSILISEQVDILHAHQAPSSMGLESLVHGKMLGRKTVFTDHSLYGFAELGSIHINKLIKFLLVGIDAAITVSHTGKDNLVLRADLDPDIVHVIPNAIDCERFTPHPRLPRKPLKMRHPLRYFGPAPSPSPASTSEDIAAIHASSFSPGVMGSPGVVGSPGTVTDMEMMHLHEMPSHREIRICVISRLTYRKGVDLVAEAIPIIARRHSCVRFVIGGDGPKRALLEEMRERNQLHDRVMILGMINHSVVCDLLRGCHIFLNASLTEAFCIAILEAVSTGLFCVSTDVGGVKEVLPPSLLHLVPCSAQGLADGISTTIERVLRNELDPWTLHEQVHNFYSWHDIADRTHAVYRKVLAREHESLGARVQRLFRGSRSDLLAIVAHMVLEMFLLLHQIVRPCQTVPLIPVLRPAMVRKWESLHPNC